jgi:hypothetical protein
MQANECGSLCLQVHFYVMWHGAHHSTGACKGAAVRLALSAKIHRSPFLSLIEPRVAPPFSSLPILFIPQPYLRAAWLAGCTARRARDTAWSRAHGTAGQGARRGRGSGMERGRGGAAEVGVEAKARPDQRTSCSSHAR